MSRRYTRLSLVFAALAGSNTALGVQAAFRGDVVEALEFALSFALSAFFIEESRVGL